MEAGKKEQAIANPSSASLSARAYLFDPNAVKMLKKMDVEWAPQAKSAGTQ